MKFIKKGTLVQFTGNVVELQSSRDPKHGDLGVVIRLDADIERKQFAVVHFFKLNGICSVYIENLNVTNKTIKVSK